MVIRNYEEWVKVNGSKPTEITASLIRQLKNEGRGDVAQDLINAHHKSLKKNRTVKRKEIKNYDEKVRRFLKKKDGLCLYSRRCYEIPITGLLCEKHKLMKNIKNSGNRRKTSIRKYIPEKQYRELLYFSRKERSQHNSNLK